MISGENALLRAWGTSAALACVLVVGCSLNDPQLANSSDAGSSGGKSADPAGSGGSTGGRASSGGASSGGSSASGGATPASGGAAPASGGRAGSSSDGGGEDSGTSSGDTCLTLLGKPCSNGLQGACARTGVYECVAGEPACNAPKPSGTDEVCGDGVDNDCDGSIDEADAKDASTWFVDCDGDGYSPATVNNGTKACVAPATTPACIAWTKKVPTDKTNTDCNDAKAAYHPGADYDYPFTPTEHPVNDSPDYDLNCDGKVDVNLGPEYVYFSSNDKVLVNTCQSQTTAYCYDPDGLSTSMSPCCGCYVGGQIFFQNSQTEFPERLYLRCR